MICNQVIPVYSELNREFKLTRSSDPKIKVLAKDMNTKLFQQSAIDPSIVYYYGINSVSIINISSNNTQNCSCRWFLAYSSCVHLYKACEIFDVQTSFAKFVQRSRRGPKKIQICQSLQLSLTRHLLIR